jgi:DUF1680 family protein
MVLGTWHCGLRAAGFLMHWQRQGHMVDFVNYNNLANTHGQAVIATPKEGAYLTAPGKLYELISRIPAWCKGFVVSVNGLAVADPWVTDGYLVLNRKWRHDDIVELILDMPVEVVASDPRVKANEGKRALQLGPVVYCLEQADNPAIDFGKVVLDPEYEFIPDKGSGKLNSMVILNGRSTAGEELVFIPYFAWDNRSPGNMKVWLDIE